jgi:short-subunit dehydrogenase
MQALSALPSRLLSRWAALPQRQRWLLLLASGLLSLASLAAAARAARRAAFRARHAASLIVVTGASQGVGAATARVLAAALPRARLVLLARTEALLAQLAAELRASGRPGAVEHHACDCASGQALAGVAARLGAPAGIVIANAGAGAWRAAFEAQATPQETERCLAAPLASALHTAHAFLPGMLAARRSGAFLCTQSPASRLPWPGATAYTAARWGLRGLCAALAQDLPWGCPVVVSEVVLTEVSDSEYFVTNAGSKDRIPWVAPLFGRLTSHGAALAVLEALEQGHREHCAPWQLRWGLGSLWLPGAAAAFGCVVKATGWRFRVLAQTF